MIYKGTKILCDADDLRIIGEEGNYQIGYWGAGGVFVELDNVTTMDAADEVLDFCWNALAVQERNDF